MDKIAIVEAHSGRIVREETTEGDLEEVVKNTAAELLQSKWMPSFSDFMILRDANEVVLKLPLSKEELNFYRKYELKRLDANTAQAILPMYLIVYESLKITEEDFHDRGIAVVTVYYREEELEQIKQMLIESTQKPSLEELEQKSRAAAELLEEEPEEKPRKKKKKKR